MLHLEYLQNQWLMLSLLLGLALVLLLAAAYMAFWRPREESQGEGGGEKAVGPTRRVRLPWFLAVVFVGITLWGVIYTVWMAFYPPNW